MKNAVLAFALVVGTTVAFVSAGALLAAGAVVYFTAGSSNRADHAGVVLGLSIGDRAIGLRGTW